MNDIMELNDYNEIQLRKILYFVGVRYCDNEDGDAKKIKNGCSAKVTLCANSTDTLVHSIRMPPSN
jgi:hypothetical protein